MRVNAKQTQYVDVTLDESTIDTIVKTRLLRLIGFEGYGKDDRYSGVYLDKGSVMKWQEEGGGSHSWVEREKIRDATELDILVFTTLDELKNFKNVKLQG